MYWSYCRSVGENQSLSLGVEREGLVLAGVVVVAVLDEAQPQLQPHFISTTNNHHFYTHVHNHQPFLTAVYLYFKPIVLQK